MKTKKSITIALADDHIMFRKGIAEIISSEGDISVIIEAGNGQELIEQLSKAGKIPDVCVLDISMPVLNGYDTLPFLKKQWPGMKVLAVSMFAHEYSIIHMLKGGADGYVSKTEDPDVLKKAIETIYLNGYYHSESIARNISRVLQAYNSNNADINKKEAEFLLNCCSDYTYQQIAELMNLSLRTIEGYRDALFSKLQVKSRSGLVMFALQTGIALF